MSHSDDTHWANISDTELEQFVASGVEAIDGPPPHVGEAARAAFELHDLDGRLMRLTADDTLAAVRDDDSDRADVDFETDQGPGSVSVERVVGGWAITGTAPGHTTVTVTSSGGSVATLDVDDSGYFEHTLRTGVGQAVRVVIGGRLVTPWMP